MTRHYRPMEFTGVRNDAGVREESLRKYVPSIFATEPHHSRSERYEFIPTWEVLQAMQKEGFRIVSAQQSKSRDASRREFTKHLLRLRHESDIAKKAVVGDSVFELLFKNSHDGTSIYELMGGLYRFVCSNGMVVGDHLVSPIKVMHRGDVADDVIDASYSVIEQAPKVNHYVEEWKRLALSVEDQERFAEAAGKLRFGESSLPVSGRQLLHARRPHDSGSSLWETYNRIQENCIKGGYTSRHNNRQVRSIRSIDLDLKVNKGLWELAEEVYLDKRPALQVA